MRIIRAVKAAIAEIRSGGRGTDAFWRDMLETAGLLGTASGVTVSPDTALKYAAFYAAVDRISCDIAKLPLKLMRRQANGDRESARGHDLYTLLHDSPNPEHTSFIFRQTTMSDALRWGNGYAEIARDGGGRVRGLYHVPTQTMQPERSASGVLRYVQHSEDGRRFFNAEDILHIRTIGDGVEGWSPVRLFRESIGLGLAAEQAGASFFGSGMRPGGVLEHPASLSDQAFARLRKQAEGQAGGASKQGRLLITEEGMKYTQLSIDPNDAQYIETRVHQVRDIARIFRLPPHKLADLADATFSNVEEMNQEYVDDCLAPWLIQWEQEIARKLLMPIEREAGYYAYFNVKGLLRGKATERANFYARLFHIGAININEIREAEDMNGIGEDGDQHFVPVNLRPADAEWQPVGNNTPNPQPVNGEPGGGAEEDPDSRVDTAHTLVIQNACERVSKIRRGKPNSDRDIAILSGPVAAAASAAGYDADIRPIVERMLGEVEPVEMVKIAIAALTGEE